MINPKQTLYLLAIISLGISMYLLNETVNACQELEEGRTLCGRDALLKRVIVSMGTL